MTPWEIEGRELVNCTCEYGCNCQFNALPDKGHCHAVAAIVIDERPSLRQSSSTGAPRSSAVDIRAVITHALRAAGLMKTD